MEINQLLTPYNKTSKDSRKIEYIVLHYVGATGSAKNNAAYFASKHIGASAHYFVGHEGEIWQSVLDKDVAWHCGGSTYKHAKCRNSNSIGIELCCRFNGTWYFEQKTLDFALELIASLMSKYQIPKENIIRHYDVTGKICPEPFVRDSELYAQFRYSIGSSLSPSVTIPTQKTHSILLKMGSTGDQVKALQSKLNELGYNCGAVDGIFGEKTKAAVCEFQRANNLGVDGIVGDKTNAALNSAKLPTPSLSPVNTYVKQIQNAVNTYHGGKLVEDGILGPLTKKALPIRKQGHEGRLVYLIQLRLNELGYSLGVHGCDGDFGKDTKSAVMAFQRGKKLAIDGIVGQNTWSALCS